MPDEMADAATELMRFLGIAHATITSEVDDYLGEPVNGPHALFSEASCVAKLGPFKKISCAVNGFWLNWKQLATAHEPATLADLRVLGADQFDVRTAIERGATMMDWLKSIPLVFAGDGSAASIPQKSRWKKIGIDNLFYSLVYQWDLFLQDWDNVDVSDVERQGHYKQGHAIFVNAMKHLPVEIVLVELCAGTDLTSFATGVSYVEAIKTAGDKLKLSA